MALGKSLGAGVPIAAAMFSEKVASKAAFGDHGSTYGGNLLACRAALVFLDRAHRVGADVTRRRDGTPRGAKVEGARGATSVGERRARRRADVGHRARIARRRMSSRRRSIEDLLVNRTADTVIRLLPAYVITARGVRCRHRHPRRGPRGSHTGSTEMNATLQQAPAASAMVFRQAATFGRRSHTPADRRQPRSRAPACHGRWTTSRSTSRGSPWR